MIKFQTTGAYNRLGLPLTKRLVEAYGGTLKICSELQGTTATVPSTGKCDRSGLNSPRLVKTDEIILKSNSILEDNELNMKLFNDFLPAHGFTPEVDID